MRQTIQRATFLVGLLVLLAVALAFIARPAYRGYKEKRAVTQAKVFLGKQDYRNASITARQALALNARNIEACRVMAAVSEAVSAPEALDWRRRIAELAPTTQHQLDLACCALRVQQPPFPLAARILDEISASATNRVGYHVARAELALKSRDPGRAADHLEIANRLEPANEAHRLNLAVLRLQSTNTEAAATARRQLEGLRQNTHYAVVALRWLIADRRNRNDMQNAERYSVELLNRPGASLEDRIAHLGILNDSRRPEVADFLRELQTSAATNVSEVYPVSAWMITHGQAVEALRWMTNFPPATRDRQPVPMAVVDCLLSLKDWRGLQQYLAAANWGELEFLRWAFLARAAAELKESLAAEAHWRSAVRQAGDRLGPLKSLLSMATSLGQARAREDVLWQIIQKFPRERWAFSELQGHYTAEGNTRGLNRLFGAAARMEPENYAARNNFAATSMLLGLGLPGAMGMARELHEQRPQDPIVLATYAYSLHLQGKTGDAIQVMEALAEKDREQPGIALYYGVLLAAGGETNRAARFLGLARTVSLLPEEKTLLENSLKEL